MKKIFTLCFVVFAALANAQTPIIDGVFSPSEGWGPVRGTGTQVGASNGWAGSDAMELYVTFKADTVFFGAKCKASSWMQFIFAVNNKAGGSSTDPWGRQITYNQTNKPDFLFRGDIAGTNYAQYQSWDGTAWQGTATNVNAGGKEVKGTFNSNDSGFIEIRVPRSLIGSTTPGDVQFIIGGNDGSHGIFDAIPNETNGTSWSAPGNATIATSYITNIALPITLSNFSGALRNNAIALEWSTSNELNANGFEIEKQIGNTWKSVGFVAALNNARGGNYTFNDVNIAAVNVYRIKSVTRTGEYKFSQVIAINNRTTTTTQVFPTLIKGGNINIRTNELVDGKANVRVLDVAGKVVKQASLNITKGDVTQSFALPNLKSGLYVVEVKTASSTTNVKVLVD
ncbi:MAG: T9SS type A sorting domain-containing protein [Chitinophagaceae bacterium]